MNEQWPLDANLTTTVSNLRISLDDAASLYLVTFNNHRKISLDFKFRDILRWHGLYIYKKLSYAKLMKHQILMSYSYTHLEYDFNWIRFKTSLGITDNAAEAEATAEKIGSVLDIYDQQPNINTCSMKSYLSNHINISLISMIFMLCIQFIRCMNEFLLKHMIKDFQKMFSVLLFKDNEFLFMKYCLFLINNNNILICVIFVFCIQ